MVLSFKASLPEALNVPYPVALNRTRSTVGQCPPTLRVACQNLLGPLSL